MSVRTIVIGSNSFSGQDFVRHSLLCGDEILGISRSPQKEQYNLSYDRDDSNFNFFQLDLNIDTLKIAKEIESFQPHYVVNFAAQSIVEYSWKSPADWYSTNVTSLARLLPHLCGIESIKKYLQISTPEVYGSCADRISESRTYHPSTPYASSKSAADVLLDIYNKEFQFPVCTVRAANVYGARQQLFKIIPKTILSILQGKKIPLHGGGLSTRSFVHISDVSKAERLVLQEGEIGDIYHISHENEISIRNLVKMICQKMNKSFDECVDIVEDRKGKDSAYTLDSTKINRLGWFTKVQLQEGITETINWIKEYNIHEQSPSLEYVHKQ